MGIGLGVIHKSPGLEACGAYNYSGLGLLGGRLSDFVLLVRSIGNARRRTKASRGSSGGRIDGGRGMGTRLQRSRLQMMMRHCV